MHKIPVHTAYLLYLRFLNRTPTDLDLGLKQRFHSLRVFENYCEQHKGESSLDGGNNRKR